MKKVTVLGLIFLIVAAYCASTAHAVEFFGWGKKDKKTEAKVKPAKAKKVVKKMIAESQEEESQAGEGGGGGSGEFDPSALRPPARVETNPNAQLRDLRLIQASRVTSVSPVVSGVPQNPNKVLASQKPPVVPRANTGPVIPQNPNRRD